MVIAIECWNLNFNFNLALILILTKDHLFLNKPFVSFVSYYLIGLVFLIKPNMCVSMQDVHVVLNKLLFSGANGTWLPIRLYSLMHILNLYND